MSLKGRLVLLAIAGAVPFFAASSSAAAQQIDMKREYYEGRWTWYGVYKAKMSPKNVGRIQFNTPTQAVYCYDKVCWNVTIQKGVGGDLFFTSDKKNYFELSANGTQIKARFWVDMKPPARSPDATTTFSRMN